MRILALDSSGVVASVALVEDDVLLGEFGTNFHKTHSTTLLPMLDELMEMLSINVSESGIDGIAVAKGPGSFTGLRIGAATAKGLALAWDVPIFPVSTLAGLACNLWGVDGLICTLMDARRGQVYTALYQFAEKCCREQGGAIEGAANPETGGELAVSLEEVLAPCAVSIEEIIEKINVIKERVTFLGDGVPVFSEKIKALCKNKFRFAPASANRQRAACLGAYVCKLGERAERIDGRRFAPEYLRLSQAERERLERQQREAGAR